MNQPKALWVFKWLDFYENNEEADQGKVLASDAASYLVDMYGMVDRDEFIENLLDGRDMKIGANRINFTRFYTSLPEEYKELDLAELHQEIMEMGEDLSATEELAE